LENILAKQLGSSNALNNARAAADALANLKTFAQMSNDRELS